MAVHDALKIGPCPMYRAVDDEAGIVDAEQVIGDTRVFDLAIRTDPDQAARGDLTVPQAKGVDQERLGSVLLVDFGREMVVDVFVPPFHLKEPVAGGEFDAGFGFLLAEFAEIERFRRLEMLGVL